MICFFKELMSKIEPAAKIINNNAAKCTNLMENLHMLVIFTMYPI